MNDTAERLLILSCSRSKRSTSKLLPSVERYDGPLFQVLRKFIREHSRKARLVDVFILSAKFGLIPQDRLIPNYDFEMTEARAKELHTETLAEFEAIIEKSKYRELFIAMGSAYLNTLGGFDSLPLGDLHVTVCKGGYGRQQAKLYDWLHGHPPSQPKLCSRQGAASIKGVEVRCSPGEAREVAYDALARGLGCPSRYQAWYVRVGSHKVAAKWFVSQLTGLAVSDFNTWQARRFLACLGIEVRRA